MEISINKAAEMVLPILLDASLKGALILAGAGLITTALRRNTAAMRHIVWSTALTACLFLPFLSATLPTWHVPVRADWLVEKTAIRIQETLPPSGALAELPVGPESRFANGMEFRRTNSMLNDTSRETVRTDEATAARASAPAMSLPLRLFLVWLTGAALVVIPIALGIISLRRLRNGCQLMTDTFLTALVRLLADRLGVRRPIVLLASRRRTMPMTWGVKRPVILLPLDALNWSPQCLRVVLLHELAHIRRADCLLQFVAHMCRAVYWFNPLAWLAVRQLRAEQERACDDVVLNSGPSAPDYAEHLLAVTAGLPVSRFAAPVALAMGRPRRIEHRLRLILDSTRDRRPLSRRVAAVFATAVAVMLVPLATLSLQPVSAKPFPPPTEETPEVSAPSPAEDERLAEVRSLILRSYVRTIKEQELSDGAIRGMVSALDDPYSEYLTPEQYEELGRGTQGTFAGVGIQLSLKDNQLTVVSPIEGSPALEAGIQPGDQVLAIDGHPTKGIELPAAVKRILGPKGSMVKLKIRHADGDVKEVALTRAQIKVPSVKGFRRDTNERWQFVLDTDKQIAYVAVTHFTATTADDLRALLQQLKEKGVRGLVIDLRFCPGGMLSTAVQIAEQFVDKGDIVTVKGHNNAGNTYTAGGGAIIPEAPLVVLINEQTASAAEVVAGALKDHKRAIVLGTRSYGKGSVQTIYDIPGKGTLRLTNAHFYLPSGRSIHKTVGVKEWGVDPTDGYYFPLDGKQTERLLKVARELDVVGRKKIADGPLPPLTPKLISEQYSDPQLAAALETLTAKISKGEFVPVGKPIAVMLEHMAKRDDLVKKRETLQKELDQVSKALGDIEKGEAKPEK